MLKKREGVKSATMSQMGNVCGGQIKCQTIFFIFLFTLAGMVCAKDVIDMEFCGDDDCYKILNVTSDATRGEIRKGYHQMSLTYHPDKVGHKSDEEQEQAHKIFVKVAAAYEILSDENNRRSYDMWVRGGRKRRPSGDEEDFGPMPAYYRDDHVRGDVKDTPAAFAAVIVTLLISVGVPVCMSMQKSMKKRKAEKNLISRILGKDAEPKAKQAAEPTISRKERRGETGDKGAREPQYGNLANISPVGPWSDTANGEARDKMADTSEEESASKSITKLDGPWSPEEDADLIKWTAKYPGGTVSRWSKIADQVGTRSEEQCIKRHAELKERTTAPVASKASALASSTTSAGSSKAASVGVASAGKGAGKNLKKEGNPLMKLPVQEFAKMVKEQQAAKATETASKGGSDKVWTSAEQTLLENAMRIVDKNAEDRWEQIADKVPGRTKKEVIQRVKELKEMLKTKKTEQE